MGEEINFIFFQLLFLIPFKQSRYLSGNSGENVICQLGTAKFL